MPSVESKGEQALGQLTFGSTVQPGSPYIKPIPEEEYVHLRTILKLD